MMREFFAVMLPYLLSPVTLWIAYSTGRRRASGWLVGLAGQVLWFVWVWASHSWGFLPLTIGMTLLYAMNWLEWREHEEEARLRVALARRHYECGAWGKLP